ncbi:MAG: DUF1844 domain-containing protein [Actinomycetota bacterium]|nr:DUF1844 domain-containing protein [Actinomycetota bacterium]
MSSLWTPSGERPIPDPRDEPAAQPPPSPRPPSGPGQGEEALSEEELRAQMAEVQRELAQTPAAVVVVNHCIGLFQLAALHLNQQPPNLPEAQLAIDAMGAIVETLGERLGEDHRSLEEALSSIRLAFVQVRQAAGGPSR